GCARTGGGAGGGGPWSPGRGVSWGGRVGGGGSPRSSRPDPAVAPLALLVVEDGLEEVLPPEVGPENVRDPDLGVRDLPQQEVRDPHLAARADEEVGIGLARRVEVRGQERLGSRAGCAAAPVEGAEH